MITKKELQKLRVKVEKQFKADHFEPQWGNVYGDLMVAIDRVLESMNIRAEQARKRACLRGP